jgi:hypothetical protein
VYGPVPPVAVGLPPIVTPEPPGQTVWADPAAAVGAELTVTVPVPLLAQPVVPSVTVTE